MSGFSGATEAGVLHGYDVVNNLTINDATKVASQAEVYALNDKISAYLKSGTNSIGNIILAGYITGSGNYMDAFIPINTCGKTVTSISANANLSAVFTIDGSVLFPSGPTITVMGITDFGIRIEVTLPTAQTANRTASIYLAGLKVICS